MTKNRLYTLFRLIIASALIAGLAWSAQPPQTAAAAAASWTWMGGTDMIDRAGVYGTKGTPDAANIPGGRQDSVTWTDGAGNLWLFGGDGPDSASNNGLLNELWRFNPSTGEWTWISGANINGQSGTYGTILVPDAANVPGARTGSVAWSDGAGNFWLFGGYGYDSVGGQSTLNDLWRYNIAAGEWTYMSGSTTVNAFGVYDTLGAPSASNMPGARQNSTGWWDGSGSLWLYGGMGNGSTGNFGQLSDLWSYNIASGQWTWQGGSGTAKVSPVHGTKGTPDLTNTPGARMSARTWSDGAGNLWLFGGKYEDTLWNLWLMNDLWRYNIASGEWTWMSGSNTGNQNGVYGTKGQSAGANAPGSREASLSWADGAGNFWLFGGMGYDSAGTKSSLNDLWRYNLAANEWTWMSGSNTADSKGVYGDLGVSAPTNIPGARQGSLTWTDGSGVLWLFGGQGWTSDSAGMLNDLWRYSLPTPNLSTSWQHTWKSGFDSRNFWSWYNLAGVPDTGNNIGARSFMATWKDSAGDLWVFGGYGYDTDGNNPGELGDLWRYDVATGGWAYMGGFNLANQSGVYGTKGTPDAANKPGGREQSAFWVDGAGNFWLFGGIGYDSTGASGYLNDLWRYNPSSGEWTWMGGSNLVNQNGVYGTKGTPDAGNIPGGRASAGAWYDGAGNLWLFGGEVYDAIINWAVYNDLWRYNIASGEWTWVSGANTKEQQGVFGTLATPDPANVPGARRYPASWYDQAGNLWLFGGYVVESLGSYGWMNDLWRYNIASGEWAWMGGENLLNSTAVYGTLGVQDAANHPGARTMSSAWVDGYGNLWMFGGYSATRGWFNEMWRYNIASGQWTWMAGSDTANQIGVYGTQGTPGPTTTPGARHGAGVWIDSAGKVWLFGGYGYDGYSALGYLNDLWSFSLIGQLDPTAVSLNSLRAFAGSPASTLVLLAVLLVAVLSGLALRRKSIA